MKIQIEFKNKAYTITYGKLKATAPTIREAINILVDTYKKDLDSKVQGFRSEVEKMFVNKE